MLVEFMREHNRRRQALKSKMGKMLACINNLHGDVVLCKHTLAMTSTYITSKDGKAYNTREVDNFSWRLEKYFGDKNHRKDEYYQDSTLAESNERSKQRMTIVWTSFIMFASSIGPHWTTNYPHKQALNSFFTSNQERMKVDDGDRYWCMDLHKCQRNTGLEEGNMRDGAMQVKKT